MARQFDRSGLYTLADFVVRLKTSLKEESKEELATTHPETSNVVRLMTVHQSKGLEFPVVIYADCAWEPQAQTAAVAFHPQLGPLVKPPLKQGESIENLGRLIHQQEEKWADTEEFKRLFYVATTRSADMLILSAAFESSQKISSPWLQLLARKFDLQTGLLVGDPFLGQIAKPGLNPDEIPDIRIWREKPPITAQKTDSNRRQLPLAEFEQSVATAEPCPLPPTLLPIEPDFGGQKLFSVSQIEHVVEQLFEEEPVPLEADRAEGEVLSLSTTPEQATTVGDIVHAVIERIVLDREMNLEQEINRVFELLRLPQNDDIRRRAQTCLESFLNSGLLTEWQNATELYRELDFLLPWPLESTNSGEDQILISGQIDALYRTADGKWRMWDFKTGARSDKAYLLHHYRLQLTLYAAAVEQLLGTPPARMELIHLGQQTTPIEYVLYPETVEELYQQVDQAIAYLRNGSLSSTV
ncbi:MAG: PD-(D/E)XK nuclease family protein [Planctomycetaceae bacterium]